MAAVLRKLPRTYLGLRQYVCEPTTGEYVMTPGEFHEIYRVADQFLVDRDYLTGPDGTEPAEISASA